MKNNQNPVTSAQLAEEIRTPTCCILPPSNLNGIEVIHFTKPQYLD